MLLTRLAIFLCSLVFLEAALLDAELTPITISCGESKARLVVFVAGSSSEGSGLCIKPARALTVFDTEVKVYEVTGPTGSYFVPGVKNHLGHSCFLAVGKDRSKVVFTRKIDLAARIDHRGAIFIPASSGAEVSLSLHQACEYKLTWSEDPRPATLFKFTLDGYEICALGLASYKSVLFNSRHFSAIGGHILFTIGPTISSVNPDNGKIEMFHDGRTWMKIVEDSGSFVPEVHTTKRIEEATTFTRIDDLSWLAITPGRPTLLMIFSSGSQLSSVWYRTDTHMVKIKLIRENGITVDTKKLIHEDGIESA